MDLVTAERGAASKVYLNNGKLAFSKVIEFGNAQEDTRSVDVADMDGDGRLDIVAGNLGAQNVIHYQGRDGNFERSVSLAGARMTASIKVADLNQDGRPDVVEGNSGERNFVHLAQEDGAFVEVGLREDLEEDTYHIAVGDLNGDGLSDIVEANSGSWNLYYVTRSEP